MARKGRALLKDAGLAIDKTLSEILFSCALSLSTLELKDGIPCLVPKDGKILEEESHASTA